MAQLFRRILVATDFGDSSRRASTVAAELARTLDASLVLVHVWEVPGSAYAGLEFMSVDLVTTIQQAAMKQLETELMRTRATLPGATSLLESGVPWRKIVAAIGETRSDLVVVGTHGRRGLTHALLGSVAEKIVRSSPVPVLTVRAEDTHPE